MKIKLTLIFCLSFLIHSVSVAQEWVNKMQEPNGNFYDIKSEFENYWSTHDRTEKGKGYKAFKRWENFVERRVYPSGDLSLLNLTPKNFEAYLKQQTTQTKGKVIGNGNNLIASATWTPIGPMGAMNGSAGNQLLKSGRLNFITIDPTNTLTIWVGAPAGGLWKSTNGGTSWSTNTDNLSVLGCSDLAIDPGNTSIMYLATGDGDAGDTRSIGVLKSTDGGLTWNTTGLTSPVTSYFLIRRLIINPANTQILLAATNNGVYRTINGGTTWSLVSTANCYDLEFKPGDPNTVYAAGSSFRVSTNGGSSFTQITSGITTGAGRMAIAVTANDVNYVYVLASNASTNGFLGLYRSTNSGTNFSLMSSSPNILDGSTTGSGTGGQGWYDLCMAASPLNKDEVVTGGVNVWRSLNGGSSWSLYGHWTGSGGAPFTHADHHDLEYIANGTLFNTNDGTVYRRAVGATSWTEISGAMNISQIYRIGLSSLTANKWITGHQDNGTSVWNGTIYNAELGGDGMDCFFDRTNDNNIFGEYQNGALMRTTNGGTTWSSVTSGLTGTPDWLTPWKQDPSVANTIYVGYTNLFKSTNQGTSWTALTTIGGTGSVKEFAIAPSNNQVIYVLKSSGIYKTSNGGTSWTNVTGTVPVGSASPQFICIDPLDANNAWVVLSGYSSGNKIFVTANGGSTWTNYSGNLPNIPANCCVYEPGSNDRIYIGMDIGIYYRDNLSTNWTLYNTGLPNVPISELEISPASPTLLHAATYGRGVWVASLFSSSALPVSFFTPAAGTKCAGAAITFSDQSANAPNAWSWSVLPGAGVIITSPTSQNPTITFPTGGNYSVSVIASNSNGAGTPFTQILTVINGPAVTISGGTQTVCGGAPVTLTASGATTYSWSSGGGTASIATFTPASTTVYTVTGTSGSCSVKKIVTINTAPAMNMSINGTNAICLGNSAVLLASGAVSYTWNNSVISPFLSVTPSVTTVYSVMGTSTSGCKGSTSKLLVVHLLPQIQITGDSMICADRTATLNASGADVYNWSPGGQSSNSVALIPNVTTTYTVLGTDVNGCSNSSAFTVTVTNCVGLNTLVLNKVAYSVFPNPTKGKLTIQVGDVVNDPIEIEILDASGKLIFTEGISFGHSGTAEINIATLAAGQYFVKLRSEEGNSSPVRIIKE